MSAAKKKNATKKKDTLIIDALTALRRRDGRIMPEDVVEAARPIKSPLHSHFEWSDTEAAKQFRLEQARYLLRVTVTLMPHTTTRVRAFVSLSTEKGYRETMQVMVNTGHRAQMLEDAQRDMERFVLKYQHLTELASVIDAMRLAQPKKK